MVVPQHVSVCRDDVLKLRDALLLPSKLTGSQVDWLSAPDDEQRLIFGIHIETLLQLRAILTLTKLEVLYLSCCSFLFTLLDVLVTSSIGTSIEIPVLRKLVSNSDQLCGCVILSARIQSRELQKLPFRGPVSQRTMRSHGVVMQTPAFDQHLGLQQCVEDLHDFITGQMLDIDPCRFSSRRESSLATPLNDFVTNIRHGDTAVYACSPALPDDTSR